MEGFIGGLPAILMSGDYNTLLLQTLDSLNAVSRDVSDTVLSKLR